MHNDKVELVIENHQPVRLRSLNELDIRDGEIIFVNGIGWGRYNTGFLHCFLDGEDYAVYGLYDCRRRRKGETICIYIGDAA